MKLLDLILTAFFISVIFVFYSLITINVDLFMWSVLIADLLGIGGFVLNFFFNKELSK